MKLSTGVKKKKNKARLADGNLAIVAPEPADLVQQVLYRHHDLAPVRSRFCRGRCRQHDSLRRVGHRMPPDGEARRPRLPRGGGRRPRHPRRGSERPWRHVSTCRRKRRRLLLRTCCLLLCSEPLVPPLTEGGMDEEACDEAPALDERDVGVGEVVDEVVQVLILPPGREGGS